MGRKLKILMIAPNPFFVDRGFAVQVYEQARELQKLGHRVTIATYHCGRDLPGMDIRRIPRVPGYGAEEVGASYRRLALDGLLLGLSLRVCAEIRPDVVHGHIHEGALIGAILRRVYGVPLLFDLQGSLTGEMRDKSFLKGDGLQARAFKAVERWVDHAADLVVTQSAAMASDLADNFGLPAEKVRLTMDGVNTEDFRPGLDTSELRARLEIPEGARVLVYLGLLTRYQGVDCLLESLPAVVRRFPQALCLVMGYPNLEHYRAIAERLGVADHVRFTGRIDYSQAARYLGLGEVALSPKLGETEANGKLYNYMACALPTVAFDTVVNREILGETGAYARLGDPASLSEAICSLLSDPERARTLGAAARTRVEALFSWRAVAERLEACYGLISRGRGPETTIP